MSVTDELPITDELREYASGWRDRSCYEHLLAIADRIDERCIMALYENIKLRELARIMYGELVSCEDNGYVCGGHKFDERMRELGIEV